MAGKDEKIEDRLQSTSENEETDIEDSGGTRSGIDRRQENGSYKGTENRSGRDRRRGFDRRSGLARRRAPDRRNDKLDWDGSSIERRDAFRNP